MKMAKTGSIVVSCVFIWTALPLPQVTPRAAVVSGHVEDVLSAEPVVGHSVQLRDASDQSCVASDVTDASGNYSLGDIGQGEYLVVENTNDSSRYQWQRPIEIDELDRIIHIRPSDHGRDYHTIVTSVDFQSVRVFRAPWGSGGEYGVYIDDEDDLRNHFLSTTDNSRFTDGNEDLLTGPDIVWDWNEDDIPIAVYFYIGSVTENRIDEQITKDAIVQAIDDVESAIGYDRYQAPIGTTNEYSALPEPFLLIYGKTTPSCSYSVPSENIQPQYKTGATMSVPEEDSLNVRKQAALHELCHDIFGVEVKNHSPRGPLDAFSSASLLSILEERIAELIEKLNTGCTRDELKPPFSLCVDTWFFF